MLPSTVVIVVLALVAATLLMLAGFAAFQRWIGRAGDRWSDTRARLFFSGDYVTSGAAVGFVLFAVCLAASQLTATGRAVDALPLLGLFLFVVLSWAGLLTTLCVHFTLKRPEPDDPRPEDLATATGDPATQWPREPAFAYPRSRLAEIMGRGHATRRRSLSMTADGLYVFAGHTRDRFVPWGAVASISEVWIDDERHWLAPRDVTIDLEDGGSLLIAAGIGHRGRALAVLLLHARRCGIPLRAIDRRAATIATAARMRPTEPVGGLRRTGVVVEIAEFWQQRLVYDRMVGAPRA